MEEIPNNPTPFIEYEKVIPGDYKNPVITHLTHGRQRNSRIFHTKEDKMTIMEPLLTRSKV